MENALPRNRGLGMPNPAVKVRTTLEGMEWGTSPVTRQLTRKGKAPRSTGVKVVHATKK